MSILVNLIPADRLKHLTKINYISIDNPVFRLHYRFTFINLLIASTLLTAHQLFGHPIYCTNNSDVKKTETIETYCWVEGTFTVADSLIGKIGSHVSNPGIDNSFGKDILEHSFYQWVCIVLFLQSLCFYVTRVLWKQWEGGLIKQLIFDLDKVLLKDEDKKNNCNQLITYLTEKRGQHNAYALRYFICEVLNLFNVIIQIVLTNWFLHGEFTRYGINYLKYIDMNPTSIENPMSRVFPKMAKCTFRKFGASGDVERFDHLCILAQNILSDKFYLFLWFWLYILLVLSGLMIIYRLAIILFPKIRHFLLYRINYSVPKRYFDKILVNCTYGDWFLLHLLGKNLDTMHYRYFIIELSQKWNELPSIQLVEEYDASETTAL